jgi:hypothetical protein
LLDELISLDDDSKKTRNVDSGCKAQLPDNAPAYRNYSTHMWLHVVANSDSFLLCLFPIWVVGGSATNNSRLKKLYSPITVHPCYGSRVLKLPCTFVPLFAVDQLAAIMLWLDGFIQDRQLRTNLNMQKSFSKKQKSEMCPSLCLIS